MKNIFLEYKNNFIVYKKYFPRVQKYFVKRNEKKGHHTIDIFFTTRWKKYRTLRDTNVLDALGMHFKRRENVRCNEASNDPNVENRKNSFHAVSSAWFFVPRVT